MIPSFSVEQFLGPYSGLVIALTICGVLFGTLALLMKDLKDATKDVKDTCKSMCEAFQAEAKEWRAEAKECSDRYANLVLDIMEVKRRLPDE